MSNANFSFSIVDFLNLITKIFFYSIIVNEQLLYLSFTYYSQYSSLFDLV